MVSSGAIIPARAPPSMDMLQTVMRPSMESARIASPAYSTTWPAAAADANFADDGENNVLGGNAFAAFSVDHNVHGLGFVLLHALRGQHVLDFARADAESQRAERAVRGSVAVAANDCLPGLRQAQFRANHVDDALVVAEHIEQRDAGLAAIAFQRVKLPARGRIQDRQIAVLGRNRVVHDGKGQVWPAHFAAGGLQSSKRLRGRHFVDEVTVDVNQRRFSGRLADEVRFPNFPVHCARIHICAS